MLRAAVLLALLLGSALIAPAPAAAQTVPLICLAGPERAGSASECGDSSAPDYPQGATVEVRLQGVTGNPYVTIRCARGCPVGDASATKVYWAVYRGDVLQFPRDFTDGGRLNDGGNAVLDRAPRYNSTWTVAIEGIPVSRDFNVWLHDAYRDTTLSIRPGATHGLRSTGFDPGAEVTWRWERRNADTGRYEVFDAGTTKTFASGGTPGRADIALQLPRAEAAHILTCGLARADCYRVTLTGAGKQTETVYVQVDVANITRSIATTPRSTGLPTLQRTANASYDIDLYYPGGRRAFGPKMVGDDAPHNVAHGGNALRVAVEKYWPVNQSSVQISEVPLVYEIDRLVWNAKWTIPVDLVLEQGQRYRLRLLQQRDAYGNTVAEDVLGTFEVAAAGVVPTVLDSWRELERTEEGILRLAVTYHNGSRFTLDEAPAGNASPLRGCFIFVPPPPPEPAPAPPPVDTCPSRGLTWGTYHDGAWNFSVRYRRDHAELGTHRFILANGTEDRWGNRIYGISPEPFEVVSAKPVVTFSTVARGAETDLLERGNRVFVTATITYHDGSPYNHAVRVNPNSEQARILNGTLMRRGPSTDGGYGPLASEDRFDLVETDSAAGRWTGYLQLTDDDAFTPVGIWTFRYEFEDNLTVPNGNLSAIDRQVVSSLVQVCPTFQPGARLPTGAVQKFRFKLYYSDCETGREVPLAAIESHVSVRVFKFDAQAQAPQGPTLSNAIIPTFSKDSRDWGIEYEIPNELFAGTFVFVVAGADSYGNTIVGGSRSRPFTTFTDIIVREVVAQPPSEVLRGESATVIFDARPGDTGVDPRLRPRIQLERFDTSTTECPLGAQERGCWVRERLDVRLLDETLEDHVGVHVVGVDTPVGLYRYSLQGRDASFRIMTGVSANFTVNPTVVTRALLSTPPTATVKGEPFSFFVEHVAGDKFTDRTLFFNGRGIAMPPPVLGYEPGRMNVTWGVPFESPTGNYTLRLTGRDVNGNVITVLTPPIEAIAAALEGRILGQPTRVLERGEEGRVLFAVGYPDGSFYAAQDAPRVYVRGPTGIVEDAEVRREGLTFTASWTPGADTPLGEYAFEVSPAAASGTGNLFPPLVSQVFRIVPGILTRPPADDAPRSIARLGSFTFSVPFETDDRFVGFELIYYGPSLSTAIDPTTTLAEVSRTPIAHTLDANARKYAVRYGTTYESPTGSFAFEMRGEDAEGNTIVAKSQRFLVGPITIAITWDQTPNALDFGEGKTVQFVFTTRYGVGQVMDETYGRPSATMLFNNQPVTPRPEVEFVGGQWVATWAAPPVLPAGTYILAVGGNDASGNVIANARSTPFILGEGSLTTSFLKTVPGPTPLLMLAVLFAVALVLARRRRA